MTAINQTPNYGLHQWQGTDQFLREDFNEDNRKLDGLVSRVEGKADRALAGLAPVSYNVYNLMLQNYYEEKYTGYKKALIFDGFIDEGGIGARPGSRWASGKLFFGVQAKPEDVPLGEAGGNAGNVAGSPEARTMGYAVLPINGCGVLTEISFLVGQYSEGNNTTYTYTLERVALDAAGRPTDTVLAQLGSAVSEWSAFEGRAAYTVPVTLAVDNAPVGVRLRMQTSDSRARAVLYGRNHSGYDAPLYTATKESAGGLFWSCGLKFSSAAQAQGRVESTPCTLDGFATAMGSIRCAGTGGVSVRLYRGGWSTPSELLSERATATLQGDACRELSFQFQPPSPGDAGVYTVELITTGELTLYDYGVILF